MSESESEQFCNPLKELRREIHSSIRQMDDGQGIPAATVRYKIQQRRAKRQ